VPVRSALVPIARNAVKGAAAGVDVARRPTTGITILIYHRVGAGSGGQMDLDPTAFDDQLAWLSDTQRVLTLDDAAIELSGGGRPVEPGVVVTFDDGTADWVDHVLPALERHRVPATFYVTTKFVDEGLQFPGDGRPISWAGLAELASSDLVTIGSHTHRHVLLDRLAPAEVGPELDRSIELLRDRIGVDARHFAYPKAVAGSPEAEAEVRARFKTAVLAGTRSNAAGADLHRLSRSPVQPADGIRWFRRKATGGLALEDDVRRAANRLRYRGATT
jgi:peptidoglycan/xylan/chitin deacetylase (PgdA/CDA1 family)